MQGSKPVKEKTLLLRYRGLENYTGATLTEEPKSRAQGGISPFGRYLKDLLAEVTPPLKRK